jgi:hypothetical protein
LPTATPAGPYRPWLFTTALVLASCARSAPPAVAPIAPPAPAAAEADPAVDLRLLEGGAEPRAPLRYRIAAGQTESLIMDVSAQLKLAISDTDPPVPNPKVRLTMEVTARSVEPAVTLEGRISRVEIPEDPTIPPAVVTAVRADMDRLVGLAWTVVFTDRGLLQRLDLAAPADANSQVVTALDHVREALRLLLPPLPEQPVGKNGRWQLRQRTSAGFAKVDQTATFRLGAVAEGNRPLMVLLALSSGEQRLNLPGAPPGASYTLTSFEGKGSGQIEVELGKIVQPSTIGWSGSAKGVAHAAGEPPVQMTMTVDSSVNVRRK